MYKQKPFDPGNGNLISSSPLSNVFSSQTPTGPYSTVEGDYMTGSAGAYGKMQDTKIGTLQDDGTMGIYQPYSRDAYEMQGGTGSRQIGGQGTRITEFGTELDQETHGRLYGYDGGREVYMGKGSDAKEIQAAQHGTEAGSIHEYDRYSGQKHRLKERGGDNFAREFDKKGTSIYNRAPGGQLYDAGDRALAPSERDESRRGGGGLNLGIGGGGSARSQRRFDRQQRRAERRMQRQQRRETRRRERQLRRRNEGGFLRRLFT